MEALFNVIAFYVEMIIYISNFAIYYVHTTYILSISVIYHCSYIFFIIIQICLRAASAN